MSETGAAPARESWREDDSALFIDYGRAFTPARARQQAIIPGLVTRLVVTKQDRSKIDARADARAVLAACRLNDDAVRVVVLSGAGGKAFVSGADISKFEEERASAEGIASSGCAQRQNR